MDTFSAWLEEQLHIRGWRPADLARHADIPDATLSRILNQSRQAGPDVCRAIAYALKIEEEIVFRRAGLLSPVPPAVQDENEAIMILRSLPDDLRRIALRILRSLKNDYRQKPSHHTIHEDQDNYE